MSIIWIYQNHHCRPTHGTVRTSHIMFTVTRHTEDNKSKATSSRIGKWTQKDNDNGNKKSCKHTILTSDRFFGK